MENSLLESNTAVSEKELSKVELENQLAVLEEKFKQMKDRASEFYDLNLYNEYIKAAKFVKGNESMIGILLRSSGFDYEQAKKNLEAKNAYEQSQIQPLQVQINNVKSNIRLLERKEFESNQEARRLEEKQKFEENKKELETKLYDILEKLYAEIPKELKDSGIQDDKALEMHDSNLYYAAKQVERYIEEIEESSELRFEKTKMHIEERMTRDSTLKKYAQQESKEVDFLDVKIEDLTMSLNLQNIIVKRLGMRTLREFTEKYFPHELKGIPWWNPKATIELNALFVENGKAPYIV